MLAKNLAYFAKADSAGIVLGARVPVVLTSRADTARARMASCAVAALYARCPASTCSDRCCVSAMDTILVVNAGSSSVKFQVFSVEGEGRAAAADQGPDGRHRQPSAAAGERRQWRFAGRSRLSDRECPGRSGRDCDGRRLAAKRASHQPDGGRPSGRSWRPELRPAGADRPWRRSAAGAVRRPGAASSAAQSGADPLPAGQFSGSSAGGLFRHCVSPHS